jgi:hypothetical protein
LSFGFEIQRKGEEKPGEKPKKRKAPPLLLNFKEDYYRHIQ